MALKKIAVSKVGNIFLMSRNYFKPTHLSLWNFVKTKNRPTKGATKNKE